jgi:hypothetical protein
MTFEWLKVECIDHKDEKWFTDHCLWMWFQTGENATVNKKWDDIPPLVAPWVLTQSEDTIREFADYVISIPTFEPKLLFALATVFINPAKTTAPTEDQLKQYQEIFFQTLAQNPCLLELTFVDILWKYVSEEINNDTDFRRALAEVCFLNVDSKTTTIKFSKIMYLFWSRHLIASPSLNTQTNMQKVAIFSIIYRQSQKRFPRFWCLFPYSLEYLRLMEPLSDTEEMNENRQYELMWRLRSGDDQSQNYYYLFVEKTNNEIIKKCLNIAEPNPKRQKIE